MCSSQFIASSLLRRQPIKLSQITVNEEVLIIVNKTKDILTRCSIIEIISNTKIFALELATQKVFETTLSAMFFVSSDRLAIKSISNLTNYVQPKPSRKRKK